MANNTPNLYVLPSNPLNPRVMQDLVDKLNYLTQEVDRLRERDLTVMPNGAAKRENLAGGIISIPYRDAGGLDGFIQVSKDGVISGYSSPTESFFPYVDITTPGNVGTGLDTLHTISIPPGSLTNMGDYLEVEHSGAYAANANTKRLVWSVGGNLFEDTGLIDVRTLGWNLRATVARLTNVSLRVITVLSAAILQTDSAGVNAVTGIGGRMNQRIGDVSVANIDVNPITLLVQGEATSNNDITSTLSTVELYRVRTLKSV